MSGVYGFYKDDIMKIAPYAGESHPKALGISLLETLYYSWPQEILYVFDSLIVVKGSDKPDDYEYDIILKCLGKLGTKLNKERKNITFYDLLSQKHLDVMAYFIAIRHSGLRYMLNAIEYIKTYGICDWIYLYNLNINEVEIYYRKLEMPTSNLISNDPIINLNDNFDLIYSMIHDPSDLGRNQFDLSGMTTAYNKVFN